MADNPCLTIRCEYSDTDLPPTEVTFRLAASYGLTAGHEANEWFIDMIVRLRGVRGRDGQGWGGADAVLERDGTGRDGGVAFGLHLNLPMDIVGRWTTYQGTRWTWHVEDASDPSWCGASSHVVVGRHPRGA